MPQRVELHAHMNMALRFVGFCYYDDEINIYKPMVVSLEQGIETLPVKACFFVGR